MLNVKIDPNIVITDIVHKIGLLLPQGYGQVYCVTNIIFIFYQYL
jgi:hypothetical protein